MAPRPYTNADLEHFTPAAKKEFAKHIHQYSQGLIQEAYRVEAEQPVVDDGREVDLRTMNKALRNFQRQHRRKRKGRLALELTAGFLLMVAATRFDYGHLDSPLKIGLFILLLVVIIVVMGVRVGKG